MPSTQDTRQDEGWHLDKRVPISIILTILTLGVGGLWSIADIKKDVEILKATNAVQRDRDERQDKSASEAFLAIRQDIQEANRKLDRLIERRGPTQ